MLQFITHHTDRYDEITGTRAVLEGGCRWVQLRMKDAPDEEVTAVGREIGAPGSAPTAYTSARTTCRLPRRGACWAPGG